MKRQQTMLRTDDTITSLSYDLNAVALTVAAEAERLASCNGVVASDGADGLIYKLHSLIDQLREAALVLRYARHSGHLPPSRAPSR